MDATNIKLEENVDASIVINTIHHFSDEDVVKILKSMNKISKIVIVHDLLPRKNIISRFFYGLDRGANIRTLEEQLELIKLAGLQVKKVSFLNTFPGIYRHTNIICER